MNKIGLNLGKKLAFFLLTLSLLVTMGCNLNENNGEEINSHLDSGSVKVLSNSIGISWENVQATNLRTARMPGNWDSEAIADPKVLKIGDNDYRMWYSGKGPDEIWRIGYATSTDGKNWTKAGSDINPVLSPTDPLLISEHGKASDIGGVRVAAVVYDPVDSAKFKLWYKGINEINGNRVSIFYAKSANGRTGWVKHPNIQANNPTPKPPVPVSGIDITGTYNDSNFFLGDLAVVMRRIPTLYGDTQPQYEMWYTKENGGKFNIHSATSIDGASWSTSFFKIFTPVDDTFFHDGTVSPTVILDYMDNALTYKLWFLGKKKDAYEYEFGLAYNNTDGQMFELYDMVGKNSLFGAGDIDADKDMATSPYVMRDNNRYKMWYLGVNGPDQTICYRESLNY